MSADEPGNRSILVPANYAVNMPSREYLSAVPVRRKQLERVRDQLKSVPKPPKFATRVASGCGGLAVSGAFALITLYSTATTIPEWVLPSTWALTAVGVLGAIGFEWLDSKADSYRADICGSIAAEVDEILTGHEEHPDSN